MTGLIDLYISSTGFIKLEDALKCCNENNVHLEISKFARASEYDSTTQQEFNYYQKMIQTLPWLKISVHGTSFDLVPTSLDPKIIDVTRLRIRQSIELTRFFGGNTVIFHSGYNSNVRLESYISKFIENQGKFWKAMIDDLNVTDITIALENTYEESPHIIKEICDYVDSANFKTCVDTGHVNSFTNYDLIYWLDYLKDYLHHFHLHNNTGRADEHRSLQDGTLNFESLFEFLLDLDKPLSLALELFEEEHINESLEFIREKYPALLKKRSTQ
jgi:sugar phosphate isomerase/epimerase